MLKKLSIKFKILVSIVTVILIFGSIATFSVFYYSRDLLFDFETQSLERSVEDVSQDLEKSYYQTELLVQSIAKNEEIVSYMENPEELQNGIILNILHTYNIGEIYSAIYLMQADGFTVASTAESFVGNNYNFRSYFKEAMKGSLGIDVAVGVTSGKLGYYFSYPVKSVDGEILGVVVAKLDPNVVHGNISYSYSDSDEQRVMVTDDCGVVIFSNIEDRIYKSLGSLSDEQKEIIRSCNRYPDIEITSLGYEDVGNYLGKAQSDVHSMKVHGDKESEEELFAIKSVDNYPFYVVLEVGAEKYLTLATNLAVILAVLVLVAAVIAALVILLLVNGILKPLQELVEEIGNMGEKDSARSISMKAKGELGVLIAAFNDLLGKLKQEREGIENKVEKRTKELEESKKVLEEQQKALLNIMEDIRKEKIISQKAAEDLQKFMLAVENASDHIVITDTEGNIIFANKAVEKITGFRKEEILGKKAGGKDTWGGLMGKDFYDKLWDTIKNKKEPFGGEVRNRRKNGEEYIAKASIAPVLNDKGDVIFFVGIERDITREKQVEEMKNNFISLAAHELRTPLGGMRWGLESIFKDKDAEKIPDNIKQVIAQIYENSQRLYVLVNDLLDVSRIEEGRVPENLEEVDIPKQIELILKELEPLSSAQGLNVDFENNYQDIPKVTLDKKRFDEVILNLVSNAIKYNDKGSRGFVKVILSNSGEDFEIRVEDNGIGIPDSDQQDIFTKFFRADNAVRSVTEGSGLGLSVVKSYIEAWGGHIGFESKLDSGTKFTVRIPLKPKSHVLDKNLKESTTTNG